MPQKRSAFHDAYLIAIALKGFDGAVELLLGIAVAVIGGHGLYDLLIDYIAPELDSHQRPHAAHFIRHSAAGLMHAHEFLIVYLLAHGILKLGIAIGLFRERAEWIFPVGSAVLVGFIVYMSLRLTTHWSYWLLAFALFDVLTLLLVLNEWRNQHKLRAA
ncbi:MAG: DUF2127 domain-containing protein [Rhizomicrobium sp.]